MNVYFDNAASTKVNKKVLNEMVSIYKDYVGNPSSIHNFGRSLKAKIEFARRSIAEAIHAKPNQIVFCSSGTEANNIALKSAVKQHNINCIISSKIEHKSVLNTIDYLSKNNEIECSYINILKNGTLDLNDLEIKLKKFSLKKKILVSLMHVNNEIGSINNIKEIAKISKRYNALYHCDAVQSMGFLSINVEEVPVDYLSASSHKFYGPLGAGFLYSKNHISKPFLHGGGQERNVRSSTENVAAIVGMQKALEIVSKEKNNRIKHFHELRNTLREGLKKQFPTSMVNENEEQFAKILNISLPINQVGESLFMKLDLANIYASSGSACSSGAIQASPLQKALDIPNDYITLRFSFSDTNTLEEVKYVIDFFTSL